MARDELTAAVVKVFAEAAPGFVEGIRSMRAKGLSKGEAIRYVCLATRRQSNLMHHGLLLLVEELWEEKNDARA